MDGIISLLRRRHVIHRHAYVIALYHNSWTDESDLLIFQTVVGRDKYRSTLKHLNDYRTSENFISNDTIYLRSVVLARLHLADTRIFRQPTNWAFYVQLLDHVFIETLIRKM